MLQETSLLSTPYGYTTIEMASPHVTIFNVPLTEGAADVLQRLADIALIRRAFAQLSAQW